MERDLVRWICERLGSHPRVLVGPGDDGAIVDRSPDTELVATTDMLMEGVDFVLSRHWPELIGRKALAVNLSDLAAMAATPLTVLVSLALPRTGGEQLAQRLFEGMQPLATEFNSPIAGGDTNSWEGPLVINVTALGEVPTSRRWLRSGAQPGDAIVVTGEFGGSILHKQFDFVPRIREALWLADHTTIHAAIDVSDGLSLDLWRICEASGCGAMIDRAAIPVASAAFEVASRVADGSTPLDHALSDGEDFELILAMPPDAADALVKQQPLTTPLSRIGSFISERSLFLSGPGGQREPLLPRGYEHRLDT